MASSNVVAAVVKVCTAALKKGDTTPRKPSEWAKEAGFTGSAASPLRVRIARVSGNGCGRTARYRPVTAEELLELIELGEQFAKQDGQKAATTAKKVRTKLYPASKSGARSAKAATRKTTTRKKVTA